MLWICLSFRRSFSGSSDVTSMTEIARGRPIFAWLFTRQRQAAIAVHPSGFVLSLRVWLMRVVLLADVTLGRVGMVEFIRRRWLRRRLIKLRRRGVLKRGHERVWRLVRFGSPSRLNVMMRLGPSIHRDRSGEVEAESVGDDLGDRRGFRRSGR